MWCTTARSARRRGGARSPRASRAEGPGRRGAGARGAGRAPPSARNDDAGALPRAAVAQAERASRDRERGLAAARARRGRARRGAQDRAARVATQSASATDQRARARPARSSAASGCDHRGRVSRASRGPNSSSPTSRTAARRRSPSAAWTRVTGTCMGRCGSQPGARRPRAAADEAARWPTSGPRPGRMIAYKFLGPGAVGLSAGSRGQGRTAGAPGEWVVAQGPLEVCRNARARLRGRRSGSTGSTPSCGASSSARRSSRARPASWPAAGAWCRGSADVRRRGRGAP